MSDLTTSKSEPLYVRVIRIGLIALLPLVLTGGLVLELWLRAQLEPPAQPDQHVFLRAPLTRMRVRISEDVPGLAKRETLFTTNSLGVRGDEVDLADSQVYKILTLGGSVTECMVLNDEDAWPHRLQGELSTRTGKQIWVGNAGRSGAMTLDYIAHARVLLPAYKPDMVIVMPGGNDLQAVVEQRYFPIDLQDPVQLGRFVNGMYVESDLALLEPSYAYFMYERLRDTALQDLAPLYQHMKRARLAADKLPEIEDFGEALDIYRNNLRSLYTMVMRLPGSPRVVFVTHPFLWAEPMGRAEEAALWAGYTCIKCKQRRFYAHRALAEGLRQFNRELLEFCSGMGLTCFDLEARLPKTLDNFYDDAHLREAGAELAGRALGEFLAREVFGQRVDAASTPDGVAIRSERPN